MNILAISSLPHYLESKLTNYIYHRLLLAGFAELA